MRVEDPLCGDHRPSRIQRGGTCTILHPLFELTGLLEHDVGGLVLVAEGVAAHGDGLDPAGHQARHVLAHDGLAEDGAVEDVADGAVGGLPNGGRRGGGRGGEALNWRRGTFLHTMGSRKTVPSKMLPLGLWGQNAAKARWEEASPGQPLPPKKPPPHLPHLLQVELLHTGLIGRDGRALDAHAVLLDGVRGVDRDLVVRLVAVRQAQIVVVDLDGRGRWRWWWWQGGGGFQESGKKEG